MKPQLLDAKGLKYYSQKLKDEILQAQLGDDINLDDYAKKEYVDTAVAKATGAIYLEITSSTGTLYINNDIRSQLNVRAYQSNKDITNEFPEDAFLWEKYDMDGVRDPIWSYRGKSVTITNLDIYKRAKFNCILDIDRRNK